MSETAASPPSQLPSLGKRRKRRRLLWGTGIALGLAFAIPWALAAAFGDRVVLAAVESLNRQLAVPVALEPGGVRFSLLRDFPNASVSFHGLRIPSSLPNAESGQQADEQAEDQPADFLVLDRLALQFSPLDLLRGRYRIRQMRLEDGHVHGLRRADGAENFRFWKAPEGEGQPLLDLDLERLECHNVELRWEDAAAETALHLVLEEARSSGALNEGLLNAHFEGRLFWNEGRVGGQAIPLEGPLSLDAVLETMDLETPANGWSCPELKLELQGWTFAGSMSATADALRAEWRGNGRAQHILELLRPMLPEHQATLLEAVDARGQVALNTTCTWNRKARGGEMPEYQMALAWTDGRLQQKEWGLDLDRMSFRASASNVGEFQLELSDFAARQDGAVLNLALGIDGSGPSAELDLLADGHIEASSLGSLIALAGLPGPYGSWSDWQGRLRLEAVQLRGPWFSPEARQNGTAQASGQLELDAFSWKRGLGRWTLESGSLAFDQSKTRVEAAHLLGPGTDAELNMEVIDLLPALLQGGADVSSSSSMVLPRIDGSMTATEVDFAALLALLAPRTDAQASPGSAVNAAARSGVDRQGRLDQGPSPDRAPLHLPRLAGELDLQVASFRHRDLHLENLGSHWRLSPGYWKAEALALEGMEGRASGTASLRDRPQGGLLLELEGGLEALQVEEVFRQFRDFGQQTLTRDHLNGRLDGDLERVRMVWNVEGRFLEEELVVQAEVRVRDGVLQDFEPVMALSRFVDIRDLQRIRFSHLHNRVRIENRMLQLPAMDIRSSALNLRLSGTHGFDNTVDYAVQVGLLDLLSKKFRKRHKDQPFEESSKEGGLNLYVHMQGPAHAPAMAFNQRETRAHFRDKADGLFERERSGGWAVDRGTGIPGAGATTPYNPPGAASGTPDPGSTTNGSAASGPANRPNEYKVEDGEQDGSDGYEFIDWGDEEGADDGG
jgi:hypothetical protein